MLKPSRSNGVMETKDGPLSAGFGSLKTGSKKLRSHLNCGSTVSVALAFLLTAVLPGQDLAPGARLLARVKEHGRATFAHIPDYACLETVDRYRLSRSINPTDTLHLEVAVVGGKELFARKGATQFQGDDPAVFVTAGMIGSGDFSATPLNLFVSDAAWITAPSEAGLSDRKPLRFEFEVSRWPLPTGSRIAE